MIRLLLILPLLAACGPDKTDTTGDTPGTGDTTGGTSDTATSTATAPNTTSDDLPTTDDSGDVPTSPLSSDTTPATTGDDTGIVTTTGIGTETGIVTTTGAETTDGTTTGDTTTGDTTTGATDDEYVAFFFAGGLDHILIHKADVKNDRCTTLHLARPNMGDPNLAITAPEMWGPVNAGIAMGIDGCQDGMPGDIGVAATAGAGMVTWELDPMQLCPKLINLDLDLEFPQDMPWVPAKDHLETMDLVVQNCP